MGEMGFLFLLVLAAAVSVVFLHFWRKARQEEMASLATRLGLAFDPGTIRDMDHLFGHEVFRRGRARTAFNTLAGTMTMAGHRVEVRMGDYRYVTGSGKHRRVHRLSYAIFMIPWGSTPALTIREEHLGDKLAGALGFDDIDFESEEFSREFCVKSGDKRFAYDVIHPRMMEFLMQVRPPSVEIVHGACLLREGWGHWDTGVFLKMCTWFEGFLDLWPRHLIDALETRGESER